MTSYFFQAVSFIGDSFVHFYGSKKYMLLIPLLVLVAFIGHGISSWIGGELDWKMLLGLSGIGALFFSGFLIWASLEADGDKEWIAKTDEYLADREDGSSQPRWQSLAQILAAADQEVLGNESSSVAGRGITYVEAVEWDEPVGSTRSYWEHKFQNGSVSGIAVLLTQSLLAVLRNPNAVTWIFLFASLSAVAAVSYVFRRDYGKAIYPVLGPVALPEDRCVYRTSNFYQHHQMLLNDAGWLELRDFKRVVNQFYSKMKGTFFLNQSCDVVVEVGQKGGSLLCSIRTLTENGCLYETNSLFSTKPTEHYTAKESRVGFEQAIENHAKWMAEVAESGVAFVTWNEAIIKKVMSSRRFVSPIHTPDSKSEPQETKQELPAIESA